VLPLLIQQHTLLRLTNWIKRNADEALIKVYEK
jgi:hypothetical protein